MGPCALNLLHTYVQYWSAHSTCPAAALLSMPKQRAPSQASRRWCFCGMCDAFPAPPAQPCTARAGTAVILAPQHSVAPPPTVSQEATSQLANRPDCGCESHSTFRPLSPLHPAAHLCAQVHACQGLTDADHGLQLAWGGSDATTLQQQISSCMAGTVESSHGRHPGLHQWTDRGCTL
jgi:hypothetical protein